MTLLSVVKYVIGLGANVFLPFIMFLIGLLFGLKPGKALRAGLTLGVAFTGITLVVGQLLTAQVAPAAQAMINRTGLQLSALDVGWPAASTISWAWPYAAIMFPLQILLNIVLLGIGFTKTLNVDLWNVWQKVFAGAVMMEITGSLTWAFIVAIAMIVIELKIGDLTAQKVQKLTGVPGISIPHACATWLIAAAPVAAILDAIPWMKKLKVDPERIQKKVGFFGENIVIGLLMGLVIGALAGYDFAKTLQLGIVVASVMVILPRMATIFMEALMPISEAAAEFMKKRFPGREMYIGLDWPITAGHPSTIVSAVLLIPVLVVLAIILPGNKVLPFGDLGNFGCLMGPAVALVDGDLVRSLILGVVILAVSLWGASAAAPAFTDLAIRTGVKIPAGATQITWLKTTPVVWAVIEFAKKNILGVVIFLVFLTLSFWTLTKKYSKEETVES
ncbi:MAG: PTS galactitol transporter subunit IIC [Candidatus Fermentithermobacillus carboniphilus]|uniref:PTS galactitol transporter subunit IIC n=1 Tax=Candidatus Fermentithermobacillus carboniphilus TaxID=3085328 RepID=A0AAT9LFM5_9FIRM|nr:MAG: PTS galactitol transporter subunit IIC [Candidatus Fermentithermobacillus carboniphilus]